MQRNFIVIEPDQVIAMDLEGILQSRYASARVALAISLQEVGNVIGVTGIGTTIFVSETLTSDSTEVRQVLATAATRGSHIVVIGQPHSIEFPATFIDMPFTSDMVIEVVEKHPPV